MENKKFLKDLDEYLEKNRSTLIEKSYKKFLVNRGTYLADNLETEGERMRILIRDIENDLVSNHFVFCSCGRKLEPFHEGEIRCPKDEFRENKKKHSFDEYLNWEDLGIFDWCVEQFKLNEKRLKEIKELE